MPCLPWTPCGLTINSKVRAGQTTRILPPSSQMNEVGVILHGPWIVMQAVRKTVGSNERPLFTAGIVRPYLIGAKR